MLETNIRPPDLQDVPDIARIRVSSWLETYSHIYPARILAQQSIERDCKRLKATISKPPLDRKMLIAEVGKRLVGFVTFYTNPASNDRSVEIRALYVDKEFHRKGVGTALFNGACSSLPANAEILRIGCLEENWPARQFYRSLGGKELKSRRLFTIDGFEAPEVVYEWNLKNLRERSDI